MTPTAESYDCGEVPCACDPGVIKFGGWYYIGYTTEWICVARSRDPQGPFLEKWTGDGWGVDPAPIISYDGTEGYFGAGEPSFVVVDEGYPTYTTVEFSDDTMDVKTFRGDNSELLDSMTIVKTRGFHNSRIVKLIRKALYSLVKVIGLIYMRGGDHSKTAWRSFLTEP